MIAILVISWLLLAYLLWRYHPVKALIFQVSRFLHWRERCWSDISRFAVWLRRYL